ncbi:hypothetical protein AZE42_10873 [Rhizopogon vesiculosus]|uniref:aminomethyltransferase n=1 Tax=Rhizopogon vesiculosus TaxID=180088 RepID=A0A1J8QRF7_9AGAM|nr:hypothetical protein AZE42_10873 [Rhizopogon vesiculosus]
MSTVRALSTHTARQLLVSGSRCRAPHSWTAGPGRINLRGLVTESAEASLRKTGLYDFHIANGGKMVPFAGYQMPLTYGNVSQVASHTHVRTKAGLFDVGEMVQSYFRGRTATAFLEWLTPSSLISLAPYTSTLSVILNEKGGIIDDTIITKYSDDTYNVVTNGARRDRDLVWFKEKLQEWNASDKATGGQVEHEALEDWGIVTLQGPAAAQYLQGLTSFDLRKLTFGKSAFVPIEGFNLHVARGGYTGEDGFEIIIPPSQTLEVTQLLCNAPDTSPVEAGLTWVIGKERRETGDFIGAEGVRKHLKDGPPRRRVGFIVDGAPAGQGAQIYSSLEKELIGAVTSGIASPMLGKNIAMGYVKSGFHKKGTEVDIDVGNKLRKAVITPMPFIKPKYWRG